MFFTLLASFCFGCVLGEMFTHGRDVNMAIVICVIVSIWGSLILAKLWDAK